MKPKFIHIVDPEEAKALVANGKYWPLTKPFWVRRGENRDVIWAQQDERLELWRAKYRESR